MSSSALRYQVDDLVSSFSQSHIGQEALDLAALQKQLCLALTIPSNSGEPSQPCNTPTQTSHMQLPRDSEMRVYGEEDDERMVEDLLLPHSQSPQPPSSFANPQPTSSFATTDPFYIAQLQASSQPNFTHPSIYFAHQSTLDSPFYPQQTQTNSHPHSQPIKNRTVDHPVIVG